MSDGENNNLVHPWLVALPQSVGHDNAAVASVEAPPVRRLTEPNFGLPETDNVQRAAPFK